MRGAIFSAAVVLAWSSTARGTTEIFTSFKDISSLTLSGTRVYDGTTMSSVTIDYVAAKGGVISMTREMACWMARYNIRVNSISPGGFWRNQPKKFAEQYSYLVPMGRMGEDGKEMKGAVAFLASEASSYVTGVNLVVDGGMSVW